jgi:hypothetical protein
VVSIVGMPSALRSACPAEQDNSHHSSDVHCRTGWFCCTKPISSRASLAIQTPGSPAWRDIHVPDDVKALVILNLQVRLFNMYGFCYASSVLGWLVVELIGAQTPISYSHLSPLQSYAGGRNLWGTSAPSEEERLKLGLKEPSYSDGLLEVGARVAAAHTTT